MIHAKKILLVISLISIVPFFFLGGPNFESDRSINELWNTGHIIFFVLLTAGLYEYWLPAAFSSLQKFVYSFLIIVVLGFGIELLQIMVTGRSFGWDDIARNFAGGTFSLLWCMGTNGKSVSQRAVLRSGAIALVVASCAPLWHVLADEFRARREFPVLSGFERKAELGRWRGKGRLRLVTDPVRQGMYAAELLLGHGKHNGIWLFYCPNDWRGSKALTFSVNNPGSPFELHFRILDYSRIGKREKDHHQYNDSTILITGWNDIVIPSKLMENQLVGEEVDLANIWAFGVFYLEPQENKTLYLDDVRLLY
jgi:hypothetical protein